MKAVVYVRVSTPGQEEGTSLDTQAAACLELAHSMGYSLDDADILRDQGTSSDPDRPGLVNLKSVLAAGDVQIVFIFATDRIARDPLHVLLFREYLDEIGVHLQFVNGPSGNSPEDRLMQYLLGYVGQRERIDIAERTNRGKRKVAQDGRLPIGTGAGLYGYDYNKDTKTRRVHENEATVVKRMFHEFAEGRSSFAIATSLNKAGIKTKRGSVWHPLTVRRILKNTCYKGETWYGRNRCRKVKGRIEMTELPESEWILVEGFTPPIVSVALFQQVQEQLAMPKARSRGVCQEYLLTGFARCELCETPMVGTSRHGKYRYYSCRATRPTASEPATCNSRAINADRLEGVVWDHMASMVSDPRLIIDNIREFLGTDGGDLKQEINRLNRKIMKAKGQERNLVGLFGNEMIDTEMLNAEIAPIRLGREASEHELHDLEHQQAINEDAQMIEQRVSEYYRLLNENLNDQDFKGKRAALTAFGVKAVVSRENVTLNVTIDPGFPTIEHTSALRRGRSCRSRLTGIRRGWMNWLPRWQFCRDPARLRCLAGTAR